MTDFINQLAFGWYPYLAVTVLVVGSIMRFDANQYSWRSQSSQFLRRKQMLIGSNLFHLGILALLGGHFVGLLTPIGVFDFFGVGHGFKQMTALVVGGIAGIAAFVGEHAAKIEELDINPLIVCGEGEGAWIADALLVMKENDNV